MVSYLSLKRIREGGKREPGSRAPAYSTHTIIYFTLAPLPHMCFPVRFFPKVLFLFIFFLPAMRTRKYNYGFIWVVKTGRLAGALYET
jgi:hypothetical protein